MGAHLLPHYVALAHKPRRAQLLLAAFAAALPVLGLCYLSGVVWNRHHTINTTEVVLAARSASVGTEASEAIWRPPASTNSCQPVLRYIPPPKTRQDIPHLLEHEGFTVGAELGVHYGVFAAETLWVWSSCKRYYLVETYDQDATQHVQHRPHLTSSHSPAADQQQHPEQQELGMLQQAQENLQGWQQKLVWMHNTTSVAAGLIREPLDYVYVDARKDYCSVLQDIGEWWPLVKPGGIMAGSSYQDAVEMAQVSGRDWLRCADDTTVHQGGVQAAVDEFFKQQGLQVVVAYREKAGNTWLVRKPYYPCNDQSGAAENEEHLVQLLAQMLSKEGSREHQHIRRQSEQSQLHNTPTEGQLGDQQPAGSPVLLLDGDQHQGTEQHKRGSDDPKQQQQQQQQLTAALTKLQADSAAQLRPGASHRHDSGPRRKTDAVFGDIFSHHEDQPVKP